MKKVLHCFLLATLSLIILVLLLFNYYVLFELEKGFDINKTEWNYWKEVINPHVFKLFYVYLFFIGLGFLSLLTHFLFKLKIKISIYIILFSIIGTINIWSFQYFEIPGIVIEANRPNPNKPRGFIEPEIPPQYSDNQTTSSLNLNIAVRESDQDTFSDITTSDTGLKMSWLNEGEYEGQGYAELSLYIDSLELWDEEDKKIAFTYDSDTVFVDLAIGEYLEGKEIIIEESLFDIINIHQKHKIELILSSEGDGCMLSDWKSFESEWIKTEVITDGLIYKIKPIDNADPFTFTKEELIEAAQKYCSSTKWIDEIKKSKSVKAPPVMIDLTFFYLRITLKNKAGEQIEKIVRFEIANGC